MTEKAPRTVIPEVLMTPELDLPGEVATIREVKAERDQHVKDVEDARQAMLNMAPSSTIADFDAALDTYNEKKAINDAFTDMWNDYGGKAVDAAQAEVDSTSGDPTSSAYIRAARKLEAAEDAFYARMQAEREAIYDDAYTEKDDMDKRIAKRITDPAKAEKKAYKEEKRRQKERSADATRVHDVDDAHEQALEENANLTRTHDVDTAHDEALEESANSTRTHNIVDAETEAHTEQERLLDLTRVQDPVFAEQLAHQYHDIFLDRTRTRNPVDAETEAHAEQERLLDLTRTHDRADAETEAYAEHSARAETEAYQEYEDRLDETRVHDVEEAHERANRMNRRGLRGWLSRMRERFMRNPNERDRRTRNVAVVIGTVAAVGAAIWAWNAGGDEVIRNIFDNKPDAEKVPDITPLDNSDGGSQPGGIPNPDRLPPTPTEGWPWDWAKEAYGDNATPKLHELADKAAASGHTIEWATNPNGTEWLKVDGNSNTQYVVDTLRQYR